MRLGWLRRPGPHAGESGAGGEDGGNNQIARRDFRRLAEADAFAVHETEEGQHRARGRERRGPPQLPLDDENGGGGEPETREDGATPPKLDAVGAHPPAPPPLV